MDSNICEPIICPDDGEVKDSDAATNEFTAEPYQAQKNGIAMEEVLEESNLEDADI